RTATSTRSSSPTTRPRLPSRSAARWKRSRKHVRCPSFCLSPPLLAGEGKIVPRGFPQTSWSSLSPMIIACIHTVIQGVLLGGLYTLFAAGLSLIFGIMRLVNLAHGDLILLAAFIILAASHALGLDPFTATVIAAPLMFAAGYGLQFLVLNRTLGS